MKEESKANVTLPPITGVTLIHETENDALDAKIITQMIDTTEQGQSRNLAQTRDEGTVNLPPPASDDTKKNEE